MVLCYNSLESLYALVLSYIAIAKWELLIRSILIMVITDHFLQECWVLYQTVILQYNSVVLVVICDSILCGSHRNLIADHFLQE